MTRRTHRISFGAGVIVTIAIAAMSLAASPLERPTEAIAVEGCFNDGCHADIKGRKVIHGPVGVNACDACHELTDAKAHTYTLTRQKAELCTYCHEFDVSELPVVHKPVSEGECLGCHDPHGGDTDELIREASMADLCARCHEPVTRGMSVLHTPVKEGACASCHPPHAARFKKLLDVSGPDLCMACHDGFEASLSRAKFTHKAMEEGCTKCHDAHGSNFAMATTQPVADQCSGCHEKTRNEAMAARYPHTPVLADRACVTCHTPHGSSLDKLVLDAPTRLCMSCHEAEQKTAAGKIIPAVAELRNPDAHRHGGIKDESCAGCHDSHGGNRQLHLSKNYSKLFYQRYSASNYELCFSCHKPELVEQTQTTTATGFRNGDRNLHELHVRDTQHRGQNCRVCHNTHAGPNDKIVREGTTYGTWKMPVRFKQTTGGGTCFPGCHPLYGYDRASAVRNTPGTATPASLMPIGREGVAKVEIEALDASGETVKIPAGDDRPTIIAVIRDNQPRALEAIDAAMQAGADARVIALMTGTSAESDAAKLATQRKWHVIADADAALAAELDVRAFPMIVVLRPDGLEVARIAGTAESLALKLPVYLEAAAGKVDPSATTRPIVNEIAGDPESLRQAREVERLIQGGKPDHAMKRLLSMPEDAIPNYRHNLLGARALLAMNRLPEARAAAEAALKQKPGFREAHLLLGRIHEQAGDWPSAAAAYRAAATAR